MSLITLSRVVSILKRMFYPSVICLSILSETFDKDFIILIILILIIIIIIILLLLLLLPLLLLLLLLLLIIIIIIITYPHKSIRRVGSVATRNN